MQPKTYWKLSLIFWAIIIFVFCYGVITAIVEQRIWFYALALLLLGFATFFLILKKKILGFYLENLFGIILVLLFGGAIATGILNGRIYSNLVSKIPNAEIFFSVGVILAVLVIYTPVILLFFFAWKSKPFFGDK